MTRNTLAYALGLQLALLSGCAAPNPFEGKGYEEVRARPALPYVVKLNGITYGDRSEAVPLPSRVALADSENASRLRESVRAALERCGVFSSVVLQGNSDLELTVNVDGGPRGGELGYVERNGWIWMNLFLWLAGGVPGWFIEDTEIDQDVELTFLVARPAAAGGAEKARALGGDGLEQFSYTVDFRDANELNFVRRAGLKEYVMQLLVPPFLVPSSFERADRALYEEGVAKFQEELPRVLKERFLRSQVHGRRPLFLVASPAEKRGDPDLGRLSAMFCVDCEPQTVRVRVERLSKDGRRPALRVYEGDLVRVDDTKVGGQEFRELLGYEANLLKSYKRRYLLDVGREELKHFDGAEGDLLRFTVDFQVVERWHTPVLRREGTPDNLRKGHGGASIDTTEQRSDHSLTWTVLL